MNLNELFFNNKNTFDTIEILNKRRLLEIFVKNNDLIPKYYYIGTGKTASKSIVMGLDKTSAHWHSEGYFETINKLSLFTDNKLTLYDYILYEGNKYNFKPLIIECYRDPISICISMIIQDIKTKKLVLPEKGQINFILSHIKLRILNPYSLKWQKYFNINFLVEFNKNKYRKFLYKETPIANLLFLRYEDIHLRKKIFNDLGYNFTEYHENKSKDVIGDLYQIILDKFKKPEDWLRKFYNNQVIRCLYTKDEIESFITKWKE